MTSRQYNILMIGASLAGWAIGLTIGIAVVKVVTRYCGV